MKSTKDGTIASFVAILVREYFFALAINEHSRIYFHLLFFLSDDEEAAEKYTGKLRPIYPNQRRPVSSTPMEIINLSDDDSDITGKKNIY